MLEVMGAAAVSAVTILFGLSLITSEFRKRWPQVIAALEFAPVATLIDPMPPLAIRPVVARRPVRAAYRPQAQHRLAA